MSVSVTYQCGGCEAVETVSCITRTWEVLRHDVFRLGGETYDECLVKTPTIESAAPEGWMPFDPYTGVCYCPKCWAEIEAPERSEATA